MSRDRSLNRTERLFALVLLLQNRPRLTSADLADHFDVSRRTIFRDLRALGESGVPITYDEEGGYEILDSFQLPPLMLSAREAATLLTGVEFMKLQPDASLKKHADGVGMKIRSVLPANVREYIDRLQQRTILDPYWLQPVADDYEKGRWYEISQAIADLQQLHLKYYVSSRDELTKRTVDPLGLVYYTDHWNLIAFDHLRNAIRNFRLDRIEKLHVGMDRFEKPTGFELQAYLQERPFNPDNQLIRIRFAETIFQRVRKTIPAPIEEENAEGEFVEVSFYFKNLEYLSRWMMQFSTHAKVLEPPTLCELVHDEALRLAKTYE